MAEAIITVEKTNWGRCFICQQVTKEKLIQPSLVNIEHDQTGYATLARNVVLFHMINALPILLSPTWLDEGDGIENTLLRNRAKYHASCKLMFNNTKLERAQKRASTAAEDTEDPKDIHVKRTRRSQSSNALCFICEDESATAQLRDAMTMQVNERINECARNLSDMKLLAKLSAGDVVAQEFKYHPACLVGLYNRERAHLEAFKHEQILKSSTSQNWYHSAFSELVVYITDM